MSGRILIGSNNRSLNNISTHGKLIANHRFSPRERSSFNWLFSRVINAFTTFQLIRNGEIAQSLLNNIYCDPQKALFMSNTVLHQTASTA